MNKSVKNTDVLDAEGQNSGTNDGGMDLWDENFGGLGSVDDSVANKSKDDEGSLGDNYFYELPTPDEDDDGQNAEPKNDEEDKEEDVQLPEEDKGNDKNEKKLNKDTESQIDDSDLITPFFDLFQEELGWEVDEEDKPKTVSELVDYIQEVVNTNTANNFADETVAALNEYVKNGGDAYSFFQNTYGAVSDVNVENLDISDVQTQRRVVAENLRNKGYSNDRIHKTLSRYEDSGILEEEAEDALDSLKETIALQKEQLVRQQQAEAQRQQQEEIQFFQDVQSQISKIDNIRGIPVTRQEREQLLRYIFGRDREGITPYQRDYYRNLSTNLIESAYFTMKGDKFVDKVKNQAQTSAAQALREKLRSRSSLGKNSRYPERDSQSSSIWDAVAKQLK